MDSKEINEEIKERIQKELYRKDLNIRRLAIKMNTTYSYVYRMVKGPTIISLKNIERIANCLETDPIYLLTGRRDLSGPPEEQKKI